MRVIISIAVALLFAAMLPIKFGYQEAEARRSYSSSTRCLPASIKRSLRRVRHKFRVRIHAISTWRRGARIAGTRRRSYHASCRAIDFDVSPRRKLRQVASWLRRNHRGGVGTYYCAMNHIHIDNGRGYRWNHCVNSDGLPRKRWGKRSRRRYARYRRRHRTYASIWSGRSARRYAKLNKRHNRRSRRVRGKKTRTIKVASRKNYSKYHRLAARERARYRKYKRLARVQQKKYISLRHRYRTLLKKLRLAQAEARKWQIASAAYGPGITMVP